MGKDRLLEINTNNVQSLALGLVDSYCKGRSNRKLEPPELEGHIEVRRAARNARNEDSIAGMCSCNDSGSQDEPGK